MSGIPSYGDETTVTGNHPWIPAGINSAAVGCDEVDGGGVNEPRYPTLWDDVALGHPTAMAGAGNTTSGLPEDTGQTVDAWVQREKRVIVLPRDFNKTRADGFRGTLDEHP